MDFKSSKSLSREDERLFRSAWETARAHHGSSLTFYLPGTIRHGRLRGSYPAISLTGTRCELACEHCRGRLLQGMLPVESPDELLATGRAAARAGKHGLLLSGGADRQGNLPWVRYLEVLPRLAGELGLFLSAHVGFPDAQTCGALKRAGLSQGLLDVMGDRRTAVEIYHLKGLQVVEKALAAVARSGLDLVPHVVAGLYHGGLRAEQKALAMIRAYKPAALVIVTLTPLRGTALQGCSPPPPLEVARLIARARLLMPEVPIALGCERPRNRAGWQLERLALLAGVQRMAVWSQGVVEEAERLSLDVRYQGTCCSLGYRSRFAIMEPNP